MKRFLFAVSMVLVFGLPSASMAGGPKETSVVAHWGGTYTQHPNGEEPAQGVACPGGVCSGDLVACAAGEGLAVTLTVFYFLESICDDSLVNHPTACDGRFTARAEECSDPAVDIHANGTILDVSSRGMTRICFDAAAGGPLACTSALEIGIGDTLTQTRLIPAVVGSPASATTETTELSATTFTDDMDGLKKKLRFKETVAQITAQPNTSCGSFGAGGCGVAGTSVRGGTSR